MPAKPQSRNLDGSTVNILNAIRNEASQNYRAMVPIASNTNESIRGIGNIITGYPALANEFLDALVNRIGKVLVTSKMYENPWAMFKKGIMEYGETIEEVFVNLAKPFEYDIDTAEREVFKREKPDVNSVFHILNYQKFYKTTIENEQLRQAFLSLEGVTDLITRIVDTLYAGARYDEFLTMKYMIARHILDGNLYAVTIPTVDTTNAKQIVSTIKGISNSMEFLSDRYNIAGVKNYSMKQDQYLIVNANFDAMMDTEVLASAFNMDKVTFSGHRVLVDGFGELDSVRLNELFKDDPNYVEISESELTALNTIPAIMVDRDWFMIFDNMNKFTEIYNPQGLYWNYFYHVWETFSISPFANGALFVAGTPAVRSMTISPKTVTTAAGSQVAFSVMMNTDFYAPQSVRWVVDTDKASVDYSGVVKVKPNLTKGEAVTVTAISLYDPTKTDSATITIS